MRGDPLAGDRHSLWDRERRRRRLDKIVDDQKREISLSAEGDFGEMKMTESWNM